MKLNFRSKYPDKNPRLINSNNFAYFETVIWELLYEERDCLVV